MLRGFSQPVDHSCFWNVGLSSLVRSRIQNNAFKMWHWFSRLLENQETTLARLTSPHHAASAVCGRTAAFANTDTDGPKSCPKCQATTQHVLRLSASPCCADLRSRMPVFTMQGLLLLPVHQAASSTQHQDSHPSGLLGLSDAGAPTLQTCNIPRTTWIFPKLISRVPSFLRDMRKSKISPSPSAALHAFLLALAANASETRSILGLATTCKLH